MNNVIKPLLLTSLLAAPALGRDVPANIKALYDSIRSKGECSNVLQGGFFSQEDDSKGMILPKMWQNLIHAYIFQIFATVVIALLQME